MLDAMADGVVLTRRVSERGVHETAQRATSTPGAVVRQRHVTERFRHQLGLAPKAYARLLRFEHARSLLGCPHPDRTLADAATEMGYYDQSHLTRDFVAFAGMTPGAYAAQAGLVPEVRFVQDAEPPRPAQ